MLDIVPFSDFWVDLSQTKLHLADVLHDATYVESLMNFEGTNLLTHLRNNENENFLLLWCDMSEDQNFHRWMYMKVSQESIDHLKRTKHWCSVIPDKSLNETVLFLDLYNEEYVAGLYVMPLSKIPREEYMPEKTIYVEPPTAESLQRTFDHMKIPHIRVS